MNISMLLRESWRSLQTESCALCGTTVIPSDIAPGLCFRCAEALLQAPGPFTLAEEPRIVAAREYGGDLTRAIEALKITGRRRLAASLGRLLLRPLYHETLGAQGFSHPFPVVPVPSSVRGRHRRGFDQAVLLARELSSDVQPLVIRRRGIAQKELNRDDRKKNAAVQYSTGAHPGCMPTGVIIVDDVVTTGASIRRCGEIVEEMGVSRWCGIALAVRL